MNLDIVWCSIGGEGMISDDVLARIANPPTPKYCDLNMVSNSQELEGYMRFSQKWMPDLAEELLQTRQRIRELEEAQRWTPVTERLPDVPNGQGWFLCCLLDEGHNQYQDKILFLDGEWITFATVTHWRPLPEPPEEK